MFRNPIVLVLVFRARGRTRSTNKNYDNGKPLDFTHLDPHAGIERRRERVDPAKLVRQKAVEVNSFAAGEFEPLALAPEAAGAADPLRMDALGQQRLADRLVSFRAGG